MERTTIEKNMSNRAVEKTSAQCESNESKWSGSIILKCCFHRGLFDATKKCQIQTGANWNEISNYLEFFQRFLYSNRLCLYIARAPFNLEISDCTRSEFTALHFSLLAHAFACSRLLLTSWNKCLSLVFKCVLIQRTTLNDFRHDTKMKHKATPFELVWYCLKIWI